MPHSPLRMGSPACWKPVVAIVLTSPKPAFTYSGFFIQPASVSMAAVTSGESKSRVWLTHWSYTSPPYIRSMICSSQSVAGHPVAPPDSMPPHQGFTPSATIWSERAKSSSHVVGTV